MKVSVVISTYQRPDRLKKAIDSVLSQTFQDFEIIVVADGDEKLEFEDKRIRTFNIPHFGNDTRPKNKGILETTGEYVAFLDDDNTWRPDHLQVLVKVLDENPKITLSYGDRWINDELGRLKPQLGYYSEFSPSILLHRNYIDTSDALVRREALLKVGGFDEAFSKYVDWNLWLRLAKTGYLFKRVPLVLTDYHIHGDQKSARVKTEREKKQEGFIPDWDPFDCEIELPYLGTQQAPRVAVFTLTYDRLDYTKKSFESLYKTAGYALDHFVVDNGSEDGTVNWLEKEWTNPLGKSHFRLNGENKGISKGSNQALDDIGKDYDIIVKVDNDCLFLTEGWLAKMVEIWKSNHRIALSCYPQGLKDNPGGAPRIGQGTIRGELVGMTKHLGGILHFVSADAYSDFRWDEEDFLHGHQDLEFSNYLMFNGYQQAYLENYFIEHINTTEGQHKDYPYYFERRKAEKTTRYETKA